MISLLCKRAQSLLARVLREESGSAAVNVVFFLIGGIALTAFVVDATRVSADGARLKQATDAAAQAVAMEAAKDSETDVLGMAQRYVAVNLGLDPENRGIYTQSDSPKKSSRNIWSLAVVSVDQRY